MTEKEVVSLSAETYESAADPILVIGVGNAYRRDDGVGRKVAEAIATFKLPGVTTRVMDGEGTDLMNLWQSAHAVFVVDAAISGARPGTIHRIDATRNHALAPILSQCSTHAFGIAGAVELSKMLGQLPQHLVVYAIEGRDFGMGEELSDEVEQGASRTIRQICDETMRIVAGDG